MTLEDIDDTFRQALFEHHQGGHGMSYADAELQAIAAILRKHVQPMLNAAHAAGQHSVAQAFLAAPSAAEWSDKYAERIVDAVVGGGQ